MPELPGQQLPFLYTEKAGKAPSNMRKNTNFVCMRIPAHKHHTGLLPGIRDLVVLREYLSSMKYKQNKKWNQ